jgi:hypothetical protein
MPSVAYAGNGVEVAVGVESAAARGTAVAPEYGLHWADLSIVDKALLAQDEGNGGVMEDSRGSYVSGVYAEGEVGGSVRDLSIGAFLLSMFGLDTLGTVEAGVKDHVFTVVASNRHPSLTLHKKTPNSALDYALAVVSSLSFEASLDKVLSFNAGVRSKSQASTSRSVTYSAENVFNPGGIVFKLAVNQAGLDAAAALSIRRAKLDIKQEVVDDRALGGTSPTDIINSLFSIELEVEMTLTAETYLAALIAGTGYAARLQAVRNDITIGAASKPTLTIDLWNVVLQDAPPKYERGGIVTQTLKFKANFLESAAKMVQVTLRNTRATSYNVA